MEIPMSECYNCDRYLPTVLSLTFNFISLNEMSQLLVSFK